MKIKENFKISINNYKVLPTGADGGHYYISTLIEYKNQNRNLTALFKNKSDEKMLLENKPITIRGKLMDEGEQYSLLLNDSELVPTSI